jgi:hypothetical protein
MCTVLLPLGVNPTAVIYTYHNVCKSKLYSNKPGRHHLKWQLWHRLLSPCVGNPHSTWFQLHMLRKARQRDTYYEYIGMFVIHSASVRETESFQIAGE